MKNLLNRLQRDEDGNAMVEYAVILGLVTAAVIGLMTTIGGSVKTILHDSKYHAYDGGRLNTLQL